MMTITPPNHGGRGAAFFLLLPPLLAIAVRGFTPSIGGSLQLRWKMPRRKCAARLTYPFEEEDPIMRGLLIQDADIREFFRPDGEVSTRQKWKHPWVWEGAAGVLTAEASPAALVDSSTADAIANDVVVEGAPVDAGLKDTGEDSGLGPVARRPSLSSVIAPVELAPNREALRAALRTTTPSLVRRRPHGTTPSREVRLRPTPPLGDGAEHRSPAPPPQIDQRAAMPSVAPSNGKNAQPQDPTPSPVRQPRAARRHSRLRLRTALSSAVRRAGRYAAVLALAAFVSAFRVPATSPPVTPATASVASTRALDEWLPPPLRSARSSAARRTYEAERARRGGAARARVASGRTASSSSRAAAAASRRRKSTAARGRSTSAAAALAIGRSGSVVAEDTANLKLAKVGLALAGAAELANAAKVTVFFAGAATGGALVGRCLLHVLDEDDELLEKRRRRGGGEEEYLSIVG